MKLKRYKGNPIIRPRGDNWESVATFNCAAIYKDGKIHVLYRAVGDYVRYAAHLGYAAFDENLNLLERPDEPVFGPNLRLWEMSIEDARLTKIEGEVYMTYVITPTPSPPGAVRRRLGIPKPMQAGTRIALAKVKGCRHFERLGVITPYHADERDVVLFPEKIGGKYAALHRPSNWIGSGYPVEQPSIWFAFLDGLPGRMYDHKVVMEPEQSWEGKKIGAGAPPIKTEHGWLEIYHGVRETGSGVLYRLGVVLLDLEAPSRVIGRAAEAILSPVAAEDFLGNVMNVVFTCGAILEEDGEIKIYYGAADQVMCLATASVDDLVALCLGRA